MTDREHIPMDIRRAVLVEAGHRCAIPTCRHPTTEIAHIVPYATSGDNSFENLIALCPNCHTRFDIVRDIDRKSIRMYKRNLAILNSRYGEFERRIFAHIAETGKRILLVAAGNDISLSNAVKDGLLEEVENQGPQHVLTDEDGNEYRFPMTYVYEVTDEGMDFIDRYTAGEEL